MDISSVILVSVLLLLAASGLMVSHVWTWRAFQQEELDAEEFDTGGGSSAGASQTSAMLGLLAAAVLVGYVLTVWLRSGWFALVFWMAVIGVACWVALLAAVDIWATKHHFGRLRMLPGGTSQAPGRNPLHPGRPGQWKSGRQESSKKEQKQRRRQRLTVGESALRSLLRRCQALCFAFQPYHPETGLFCGACRDYSSGE